jgi:tungstate transport system ATP-binding protein
MTMEVGFEGLRKSYTRKQLFDGLDFRLRGGELLLLSGANGAGKTTMMRILAGLERADAGTLLLNGRRDGWRSMKTPLRRHTVYLHQAPYMFDGTVFDNAAYPLPWLQRRRERLRVLEALDWSGLGELAGHRAQGLSGGQRQRVALVRALISRPDFLFMDEPTANLDMDARQACLDLIRRLRAEGMGLIVSSHAGHRLGAMSDRHLHLADGQLRPQSRPGEGQAEVIPIADPETRADRLDCAEQGAGRPKQRRSRIA